VSSLLPTFHATAVAFMVYTQFLRAWRVTIVVVVEQGLTSHQTHYRSYRGRVLWVKRPNQQCQSTEVTIAVMHGVGRAVSCVCEFVCLSACVCVRALEGNRLERSTSNLVDIQCMAGVRHVSTRRSKGQRSRSRGYQMRCLRGTGVSE